MKKKDLCCLFAVLAAIVAITLVSLFSGYNLSAWGIVTWVGVVVVIGAALVCFKCRQQEEEDQD